MDMDDKRRYFIVGSVILEVVAPLFRTRLERDYTSKGLPSLQAFLNTQPVIHILFHLRHRFSKCCVDGQNCHQYKKASLPLISYQWKRLYLEKPGLVLHDCHCKFTANPIKLEDLDITLSSLILLNCNNLTQADKDAIQCLRQYKNDYLSHNTTGRISTTEYNSLWKDLTIFILQLDPSKQDDLMRIKNRPSDEALCNIYTLNLLDIHKKLDEMDISIQGVKSDVQGNMKEILLYIRKEGCSCRCGNSEQQNKDPRHLNPYALGQDVFKLHHQINLTPESPEIIYGLVSDIMMMDDGRLVMCLPDQKRLLICDTDGSKEDGITLQGGPLYVTAVNSSTVAVTLYDSGHVEMYDINNKLKLKSIAVSGMWWWGSGITTINQKLVVHGDNSLLIINHQTGVVEQKLQTSCFLDRLHGSGDRIFYWVNYQSSNELYWYSYTDDKHHTLILPSPPRRMTTIQDGSLYVKCEDGSVQHVSYDCKQYKTVKTKELQNIDCLAYNLKQRQMVIKYMDETIVDVFCDH